MGINVQVFASDPFENEAILEVAKDAAENVVYPFYYLPGHGSNKLQWFETEYARRYGHSPEGSAALAYNGLDVLVTALRLADDNRDTAKIKQALYSVQNFDGVLGTLTIDNHGDMHLPVFLKTVREGRFVEVQ
jgi:branched-chain amino acid transport system substrate-binding protein